MINIYMFTWFYIIWILHHIQAFSKMMTARKRQSGKQATAVKRMKSGHEHTKKAFCMSCFCNYKLNGTGKFWLARFNPSSTRSHADRVHKGNAVDIFSEEDPRCKDAIKAFEKLQLRYNLAFPEYFHQCLCLRFLWRYTLKQNLC